MIEIILAIKDRALDAFMRPFTTPHRNAAIRSFTDEANRKTSEINNHPEDYDLYQLGTFDQETGKIEQTSIALVARAQDLVNKET